MDYVYKDNYIANNIKPTSQFLKQTYSNDKNRNTEYKSFNILQIIP